MGGGTVGLDADIGSGLTLGGAVGYYTGSSKAAGGYHVDPKALQVSVYGAFSQGGMHANLSGTWSDQKFDNILRPAAYGLTAAGRTQGTGLSATGEFGFDITQAWGVSFGPVVGFHYLDLDIDGYTETGAAGGNIVMPYQHDSGFSGFVGGEAKMALGDELGALLRVTYDTADIYRAGPATFVLASALDAMGTQTVVMPGLGQAHVEPSITLSSGGLFQWSVSYGARLGVLDGTEHHVTAGLKMAL